MTAQGFRYEFYFLVLMSLSRLLRSLMKHTIIFSVNPGDPTPALWERTLAQTNPVSDLSRIV